MRKFKLENFDHQTRDILQRAQNRAEGLRHAHVDLEHFLLIALSVDEAKQVVLDHEVDVPTVRNDLNSRLSMRPKDFDGRVYVGKALLSVLQVALDKTPEHLKVNVVEVMTTALLNGEVATLLGLSNAHTTSENRGPKQFAVTAFDAATKEALASAQSLAAELGHSHVDIAHFLVRALSQAALREALAGRGIGAEEIVRACSDELDGVSRSSGDRVFVAKPLLNLLVDAQEDYAPNRVPLFEVCHRALKERKHLLPASSRAADAFLGELVSSASDDSVERWFAQLHSLLDDDGYLIDEGLTDALLEWLGEAEADRARLALGTPAPDTFRERYEGTYQRPPSSDLFELFACCDGIAVEVEIAGRIVSARTLIPSQAELWGTPHRDSSGWAVQIVDHLGDAYFPLAFDASPSSGGDGAVVRGDGQVCRVRDATDPQSPPVVFAASIADWLNLLTEHDFVVEDTWAFADW